MEQTRPVTILIVDDQFVISLQLSNIFKGWSRSTAVVTARDGEDGLRKARQHYPDLIITDLSMPRMDGYDMVKQLRQEQPGRVIPILGLSGSDPGGTRTAEFRDICDDFLPKPFLEKEVLAKTVTLLKQRRLTA